MARGRPVAPIQLNDEERTQLMSLAHFRSLPHGLVQRAQIVLACPDGEANSEIAPRLKLKSHGREVATTLSADGDRGTARGAACRTAAQSRGRTRGGSH